MTIEQLEQRTRRLTIGMIALFCSLAVAVGFNVAIAFSKLADVRKELNRIRAERAAGIQSQQFRLVDKQGQLRGHLTCSEGRGVLLLLDDHGNPRVLADAAKTSPVVQLLDESGQAKVSLLLDRYAGSVLVRSPNSESAAAVHAAVGSTGPRVRLLDDAGQEVGLVP